MIRISQDGIISPIQMDFDQSGHHKLFQRLCSFLIENLKIKKIPMTRYINDLGSWENVIRHMLVSKPNMSKTQRLLRCPAAKEVETQKKARKMVNGSFFCNKEKCCNRALKAAAKPAASSTGNQGRSSTGLDLSHGNSFTTNCSS